MSSLYTGFQGPRTHPRFLMIIRWLSPLTALVYPIPLAFFVGVFLRSAYLTYVRREVAWRGRRVRT